MVRPIYFWVAKLPDTQIEAKIYLLGNPAIYWLSFVSVILLCLCLIFRVSFVRRRPKLWLGLLGAYFANWLPFIFITRQMFLYHYFAALVFSVIILSALVDEISRPRWRLVSYIILGLIFFVLFIYFSPFTYGLPLSPSVEKFLFWFPTWR